MITNLRYSVPKSPQKPMSLNWPISCLPRPNPILTPYKTKNRPLSIT
ncbi:Uncharacterised protein [Vibrio cholerae]|nr:Uncharacterised protein [Vibrio cholerae]